RDDSTLASATRELAGGGATVEPVTLDVTDTAAVADLVEHVRRSGTLRAVAHAAGISPTMADWRKVIHVDLFGTALLLDALLPLAVDGTAVVCFASMAANFLAPFADPIVDKIVDDPLSPTLLDDLGKAAPGVEDSGAAYSWAKRGVQRLVRRE